jgi:endonuclease/exonuclease/phosphatase family metal-dependent hydrolase
MRLATFNVENMFERVKAMNMDSWEDGREILEDFAKLTALTQKPNYSAADKKAMMDIMAKPLHKGLLTKDESKYIWLRRIRGKLQQKVGNKYEIGAAGRGDWIGWFELKKEPITDAAVEMTARVMKELKADVLGVVEAEDRIALKNFNLQVLKKVAGPLYDEVLLIDGNDARGIDVGLLARNGFSVDSMCSHIHDKAAGGGHIFRRDCTEYHLQTPGGGKLLVMVTHLKSKGYGSQAGNNAIRKAEAARIRQIYDKRRQDGLKNIAIVGDFNDLPDSDPLSPLLNGQAASKLTDVFALPTFQSDGRPGTHGNGTKGSKFDYILLSPELAAKATAAGVERRGVWGGKNGTLWPIFPEMKSSKDAASDHAAVWVDLNL